jgi:hypothetical protein
MNRTLKRRVTATVYHLVIYSNFRTMLLQVPVQIFLPEIVQWTRNMFKSYIRSTFITTNATLQNSSWSKLNHEIINWSRNSSNTADVHCCTSLKIVHIKLNNQRKLIDLQTTNNSLISGCGLSSMIMKLKIVIEMVKILHSTIISWEVTGTPLHSV